jgi:hypothetical protein
MPPARVQVSAARLCVAVLERPKWAATALREAHATLHRVRKNKLPAAARVVHAAEDARLHLAGRMADALQRVPSHTPHPTPHRCVHCVALCTQQVPDLAAVAYQRHSALFMPGCGRSQGCSAASVRS